MQSTRCFHKLNFRTKDILFLLFFLGTLFFILLGTKPLFVPDEGRYAEIAREMAASGNFITPHLNGIKYFEKPVLFYWLAVAAIKIGGLNLWSLRSINALLGLLGCLMTYWCGCRLYNRTTGLLAALILGTSVLYFVMIHMISLDIPVTVFLTASLYCFLLSCQGPPKLTQRYFMWTAAIAAGLAVLSKGLIGIVFPILIISTWLTLTHQWQRIKSFFLPSSIFIFLLITLPWHTLVSLSNPEFFHFYFIEQHFLRYTTTEIGHYQPVWFFLPILIIGLFPWIFFLPQAILLSLRQICNKPRAYHADIFFLLWAFLIFIFFSFSKSKLIPYILPVFPPLAILIARYLQQMIALKTFTLGIKIACSGLLITAIMTTFAIPYYLSSTVLPHPQLAALYLYLALLFFFIGSLLACFYAFHNTAKFLTMIFASTCLSLMMILAAIPAIDTRTIRPLAIPLKSLMKPQDEIITYNQYFQDLPFYLERRVSILNWRNELSYGMQYQNTHAWMIDDDTFWQRFHSKQRV
ncbi:MAG: phospholipid carrier-dependent glycosyltransferase, partial [Gammaproteobacteria bacterium]|nr:phospholipid carrier-dependent glycosyltransferase [Gammaproteobacteria bacterium]